MFPGLFDVNRQLWPSRAETYRNVQLLKTKKYTNYITDNTSYQAPTPTCLGTKVPSSGSFSATKFRRSKSIPSANPTDYNQLCKQPSPGILLDIRTFVDEKLPDDGTWMPKHVGVDT